MLWSVGRSKKYQPNTTWEDRLKFKNHHYYKDDVGNNRGQYFLNCDPDIALKVNYDLRFQKPDTWEECVEAYILIERFLRQLDKTDFTESCAHLWEGFVKISTLIKNDLQPIQHRELEMMGSIFLRLFDTMPLYKTVSNEEEWKLMFHAKYIASMLVRNDQVHFNRTKNELVRWRFMMQKDYFKEFQLMMAEQ